MLRILALLMTALVCQPACSSRKATSPTPASPSETPTGIDIPALEQAAEAEPGPGPASQTEEGPRRLNVLVTSYWTADERFYAGPVAEARGEDGQVIGQFPAGFLDAVKLEGWGRISSGLLAGRFIGYDPDKRRYLLANAPLDACGRPLVAWKTIATGPDVPRAWKVRLTEIPRDASPDAGVLAKLAEPFVAADTGSAITRGRIDIYVGVQDRADMNRSPAALRFRAVAIVQPPASHP
ncbi:MAG: hypothetical protein BIFFINMI_00377 [Phycisphaerae bacterium]|nr:hypothetical protein [Phycisphaerae bacterium]